jgi:3-hydroxyacyl-CoA dehydrogenase
MVSQKKTVKTVACVGAGTIGRGWAVLFAGKGINVILHDINKDALTLAKKAIRQNFRDLVKFRLLSKSTATAAARRISYTIDLKAAVSSADYVQECVPEQIPVKRKVIRDISSKAKRGAVIASSSGGLSPSKIQSAAIIPGRCLVVHPCQIPVHLTRLVEIVPGRLTDPSAVRVADDLMRKVGKHPILVKHEVQDYITNRLQFTLWREAIDMVGRGIVSAEDVDTALCEMARGSTSIGLGPFLQTHLHGGPHGEGEVEAALKYYSIILPDTWRSLAKWSSIPKPVLSNVRRSVRELVRKRGLNTSQMIRWRDRQLLGVAHSVWCG